MVLKEFGTELPENVAVHVHDSTADLRQAKFSEPHQLAGTAADMWFFSAIIIGVLCMAL